MDKAKNDIYNKYVDECVEKIWDTYDYDGEQLLGHEDARTLFVDLLEVNLDKKKK